MPMLTRTDEGILGSRETREGELAQIVVQLGINGPGQAVEAGNQQRLCDDQPDRYGGHDHDVLADEPKGQSIDLV